MKGNASCWGDFGRGFVPNLKGTCPGRVVRRPEQLLSDREVKEICEQVFNRVWGIQSHAWVAAGICIPADRVVQRTWMIFTLEGKFLSWLATQVPAGGQVVETGSFKGRSARTYHQFVPGTWLVGLGHGTQEFTLRSGRGFPVRQFDPSPTGFLVGEVRKDGFHWGRQCNCGLCIPRGSSGQTSRT